MNKYTQTYTHLYIHIHTHTYVHTYVRALNYIHYITLHYITVQYSTLQYITSHRITSHHITWHYITLHYITLVRTYVRTYHAYMHTCIHAYMHICVHAYMHTYMHTCMHAFMHACIHTYMHPRLVWQAWCPCNDRYRKARVSAGADVIVKLRGSLLFSLFAQRVRNPMNMEMIALEIWWDSPT